MFYNDNVDGIHRSMVVVAAVIFTTDTDPYCWPFAWSGTVAEE